MMKTKDKKTASSKSRIIHARGKTIFTALFILCFYTQTIFAQTIPSNFFGINYWMPYQYINSSAGIPGGFVNYANLQTQVMQVGASFFRIGGNGYDEKGTAIGVNASNNDYIAAIAAVRAVNPNAKFLIQIPFESELISAGNMTVLDARDLVNNIEAVYDNEVFYYAIGNEWDRYVDPAETNSPYKFTAAEMKTKILAYALEMKKADPTILIVAPAVSYFAAQDQNGNSILSRLIGGTDDITGIISGTSTPADGKYYIDVVDYHTYAAGNGGDLSGINSGNYTTYRNASIAYPNVGFATELSTSTPGLQYLLNTANTANSRTGANKLTYAITEININWKNPPLTGSASVELENTPQGLGPRSFFAGQYWLDMYSSILKNGTNTSNNKVEFVMPWAIHEHGGDGLNDANGSDLSMTKGVASSTITPTPVPTYWHHQMVANNFVSGCTYLANILTTTVTPNYHKAFAYKNTTANEVGVLIINQTEQSPRDGTDNSTQTFGVNFNNTTPASGTMKFKFDGGVSSVGTYTCSTTKETTTLLVFDITTGALKKRQTYSLGDALRTTDTGTYTNITTQSDYTNYVDNIRSDIKIGTVTTTTITAASNETFRATNSIQLNGPFSASPPYTLSLLIDQSCP